MWNLPRIVGFKVSTFLESTYEGNHRIQALADIFPFFLRLSNKKIVSVL